MSLGDQLASVAIDPMGLTASEIHHSESARERVLVAAGVGDAHVGNEVWRAVVERVGRVNERAARAGRGRGRCKQCEAPVMWVTTVAGKPQALNPLPRDSGNVVLEHQGRSSLVAVTIPPAQLPVVGRAARLAHAATCSAVVSLDGRRGVRPWGRDRPALSDQVCPVCEWPLHRLLVEAGMDLHPMCAYESEACLEEVASDSSR